MELQRAAVGDGEDLHIPENTQGVKLAELFVVFKRAEVLIVDLDLVVLLRDCDEEGRGRVVALLLSVVGAILARVSLASSCGYRGLKWSALTASLQVDGEPMISRPQRQRDVPSCRLMGAVKKPSAGRDRSADWLCLSEEGSGL